ncbi:MAG: MaoC/PaaZ C-terminal domain-containing protein [Chloroflexota bacterium]
MLTMTDDGPRGLYFEEFEEGSTMMTRARTITEADLVNFAGLTGDYNPLHTDANYAASTVMEQRIAHGMLVMSYAVGQAYQLGILERTVIAFRALEVKFSRPVFIGDTIRVALEVTNLKAAARLGGGVVDLKFRILNQDDNAVQKGTMTLLMASRPDNA